MKAYHYDASGVYTFEDDADIDPAEYAQLKREAVEAALAPHRAAYDAALAALSLTYNASDKADADIAVAREGELAALSALQIQKDAAREAAELLEPTVFIVPANATLIAPPAAQQGFNRVFANGAWAQVAIPAAAVPPEPTDAELWLAYQRAAKIALDRSDMTALRCFKAGVAFPADWQIYAVALRAIVAASSGDPTQALPVRPAYPANT